MKVLKFGGTSVGSAQRMKEVAKLITDGEQKIVVLSAMSGTTNTLVEISDYLYKKNPEGANEIINKLEAKYKQHVDELYSTDEYKQKTQEFIKAQFDYIRSYTKDIFTLFEEKVILAQGELISTNMVTNYLQEQGVNAILLPALEFMRTDKNSEPDPVYIKEKLAAQLEIHPDAEIYITQGFICRNAYGEVDNLQRGGSDYTASLIGAAVNASEIQIWTDIDGMHNNDPRIVDKTSPVRHLHFEEAAELAYFGAKILHPTCIQPAKYANIPVRLLNTMDPTAPGTLISNDTEKGKIKAVAAKDNITAIKIKSSRMLLAHGFLRKVFEIFESYQTAIDMVCTSEVGVSMSIDNTKHLNEIVDDLKKYGSVQRVMLSIQGSDVLNYINAQKENGKEVNLGTNEGVYIAKVDEDGNGAEAGLKEGDVITKVDGKKVTKMAELQEILNGKRPGNKMSITYLRNKKASTKTITLKNAQGNTSVIKSADLDVLGGSFRPITESQKNQLNIKYGVEVMKVNSGALKDGGISRGFIIQRINDNNINTIDDLQKAVKSASTSKDPVLYIQGVWPTGKKAYFAIPLQKD